MSCTSFKHQDSLGFHPVSLYGGIIWEETTQPYIFCSSVHLATLSGGGLIERGEDPRTSGLFPRMPSAEPWCQELLISGTSCHKPTSTSHLQSVLSGSCKRTSRNMVCGRVNEARQMNRSESATLLFTGEFSSNASSSVGQVQACCGKESFCDCFSVIKSIESPRDGVGFQSFRSQMSQQSVDLLHLWKIFQDLRTSGWYYEGLNMQESVQLLSLMEVGTFIIRDSSDSRYLFSLSLHTDQGPTSVRIHFKGGLFSLDSDQVAQREVPSFASVHDLVSYYTERGNKNKSNGQVWLDGHGQVFGSIVLKKPLVKSVPSLKHLSRLAWNKLTLKQQVHVSERTEGIPPTILNFLTSYPYKL